MNMLGKYKNGVCHQNRVVYLQEKDISDDFFFLKSKHVSAAIS